MRAHTVGKGEIGKRFAIVIGVAAAGVMALGAQSATAAPDVVKYETELDGHKERFLYHGSVKSEFDNCEPGRRVVLFKQLPGADRKVGTDRSDSEGWFEFTDFSGRHLYAKVRRESGNGYVCRADRSPNHGWFSLGPPDS